MTDAEQWYDEDESDEMPVLNGGPPVPPNWADMLLVLSYVPKAALIGAANGMEHLQHLLQIQSRVLDERKERTRFAREASKALRGL